MKTLATATLAAIVAATSLAGYLQHVAVDMSDSRQNYPLRVARGEVVDLSVDFFDEGAPIGFESGASATLHTRTNSMDAAYSWQTSGSVSSNAALFVLDVDAVLPAASGEWTVVVEGGGRVLARAGGQAYVRGGAAASVAADPVSALSGYATTGYVAQAVAAIDVTESDPVWEAEKDGYARAGDLGSAAFVDTPRKYALDATNIVSITIQPLTTSDWQANYIGGFAISHPDYGSVSLSFPDDFTETESGWFGSVEMKKTAPRQFPRYFGSVLITNLVFGAELSTMTSSAVECSMDCFADWQGDSDNIHFAFYTRNNWHDGWMSVGEAADLSASRVAAAATNYTDAAIAAIDIPDPDLSFTNDFLKAESDPVWSEWVAARTNGAGWFYAETAGTAYEAQEAINAGKLGGNESSFFARASDLAAAASAATNYTDGAVAALDFATPTDVATEVTAASNALARAWSADSVLLSSMLLGSNVVAEVTNYNSQVRSPTLRLLQLNESNEYFQVWAETNNLSRVALAATNHADTVSAAAYVAATNFAAPRAWSGTTSGLGADAPEGWTWISTPNLAIGGGLEFEKHVTGGGEIWVLKNNGLVAQFNAVTNNAAYLEIASLDGESVFRIEKTDSVLLGVDTTSVSVDGNTLVCGVAAVSAEHPLARVRASLTQGDWTREEDGTQSGSATILPGLATVEWSGQSGAWVCRITNDTGGHSIFATMQYLQEGGTKIVPAAPMDGSAGILCTDGVHKVRPVYSNGAITWEVFQ